MSRRFRRPPPDSAHAEFFRAFGWHGWAALIFAAGTALICALVLAAPSIANAILDFGS